jgi:hypothetical protein
MTPDEKKNDFDIIEENKGFTMECLLELQKTCNISTKDMQNMQVCYKCAKEKPNHLFLFNSSGVMVSPQKYLNVEVKPENRKISEGCN